MAKITAAKTSTPSFAKPTESSTAHVSANLKAHMETEAHKHERGLWASQAGEGADQVYDVTLDLAMEAASHTFVKMDRGPKEGDRGQWANAHGEGADAVYVSHEGPLEVDKHSNVKMSKGPKDLDRAQWAKAKGEGADAVYLKRGISLDREHHNYVRMDKGGARFDYNKPSKTPPSKHSHKENCQPIREHPPQPAKSAPEVSHDSPSHESQMSESASEATEGGDLERGAEQGAEGAASGSALEQRVAELEEAAATLRAEVAAKDEQAVAARAIAADHVAAALRRDADLQSLRVQLKEAAGTIANQEQELSLQAQRLAVCEARKVAQTAEIQSMSEELQYCRKRRGPFHKLLKVMGVRGPTPARTPTLKASS